MDGVEDFFAKSVMGISGVGQNQGGEILILEKSFVQGIEGRSHAHVSI